MKIAISNLAWEQTETDSIAAILLDFSIKGVEIAPTKVWSNPLTVSSEEAKTYKRYWQNYDIQIVALQSLLFGRGDLTIFETKEQRLATRNYLSGIIQLAGQLGANVLVFGSPKNRLVNNIFLEVATEIAVDFFSDLGDVAVNCGVKFCLEPNPRVYGCDFINTSAEGFSFVNKVNNPGFGLHLDAAGMTLSQEAMQRGLGGFPHERLHQEAIATSLEKAFPQLCHFHISEPNLQIIGSQEVRHDLFAHTLTRLNYQGWVSIEMLAQNKNKADNLLNVKKALVIANKHYGKDRHLP
ncbi:sugar phosphate isomerase/epimerase [Gloeocapsa sp. PCC 73106]|uniref:sugar phosphate isomerase/epimerase family protein n=1 Tax=Gloeocapsa sp. PCC 73106 TaxID=102232 RepID=UPI0002ABCC08|nr:sugar phosphate isomerase/epimerase family protein [Gloeocapsa sp. PCC 73106]ELR97344.1 xylose isomerase-like enzyme [Gloeocapsa sp. PCC 73106]